MKVKFVGRALGGIVGNFSDPTNERIIYLSALALGIVGIGLLVGTVLWWRRGRQEHPALAPLEVMGTRPWVKAPQGDRQRRLDHVRLAGAGGAEPGLARSEPLDLQALVRSVPQAFDDLREPGEAADADVIAGQVEASDDVEVVDGEESGPAEVESVVEPDEALRSEAAEVAPEPEVDATMIATERPVDRPNDPIR
ncbi:MAG: hypothetical protein ABI949_11030 [Ilumatobacteraceae bacterium]